MILIIEGFLFRIRSGNECKCFDSLLSVQTELRIEVNHAS